jgi:hypothetical protein
MSMDALPRLGSIHDIDVECETNVSTSVSEVPTNLAPVADTTSVPRPAPTNDSASPALDPFEAWMFSVVRLGMCVQGIIDISPLSEDETLTLLARLVSKGLVTFRTGRN